MSQRSRIKSCSGPVADFVRRYLTEQENKREHPSWDILKRNLTTRFADITDPYQAFAVLRKTKQGPNESVQLYAERLLNVAEDAYPQPGDRPVVEQQMINIFLDGLFHDYLKMKILREDPQTFDEAVQIAAHEQNIRTRFSLRQENEPKKYNKNHNLKTPPSDESPMECDHFRRKRCYKCKRIGHWGKDCKVKPIHKIEVLQQPRFGRTNHDTHKLLSKPI